MCRFNVGDRVRCTKPYGSGVKVGETGSIVRLCSTLVKIEWDNFREERHDCGGLCATGHGWNLPYGHIEHAAFEDDFGELPKLDITSIL